MNSDYGDQGEHFIKLYNESSYILGQDFDLEFGILGNLKILSLGLNEFTDYAENIGYTSHDPTLGFKIFSEYTCNTAMEREFLSAFRICPVFKCTQTAKEI